MMGRNSAIAWTDDTFNPWWGCMRVGPGCDNCYAADLDKRFGGEHWDGDTLPRRTKPQNWNKPIKWNREAEAIGVRRKVFCASMADVFDNRIDKEWRNDLWALVRSTPWIDWIILTKRIGNVAKMLPDDWGNGYQNVWLVITVVNEEEAERDCPKLRDTPALIKGLSVEPQIGPIILSQLDYLDWVICGAESGPHRRPFNEDWARALRDQCNETDTAFFYKQVIRSGKKVETPELDGETWVEFPSRAL